MGRAIRDLWKSSWIGKIILCGFGFFAFAFVLGSTLSLLGVEDTDDIVMKRAREAGLACRGLTGPVGLCPTNSNC